MRLYSSQGITAGGARLIASLVTASSIVLLLGMPLSARACPAETEKVRKLEVYGSKLPDCRAFEQVSPTDKNTTDAEGKPGYVQASPLGDSVSYYSVAPFPGIPASYEFPPYLSTRTGNTWSTQGLDPLSEEGVEGELFGLTANNGEALVYVGPETNEKFLLAPGAELEHANAYVHDNTTGEYRLLGTRVNEVAYVASTPDGSHLLVTSNGHEVVPGVVDEQEQPYLYEWDRETGHLSFVGIVNEKAPEGGTVAGSNENGGKETYEQNTISENGSRIFFSEAGEGQKVYMREPNANQPKTDEVSLGQAQWRAATPDGTKAFYTEEGNLYEFDASSSTRKDITGGRAGVLGMVGISRDGSYAYFVAETVIPGENEAMATAGEPNLYEWHEGAVSSIRFIATLNKFYDKSDWRGFAQHSEPAASAQGYLASRVSASGTKVLISSYAKLTNYENANQDEIYLYDATEPVSAANPRCLSCSPIAPAATQSAFLSNNTENALSAIRSNQFITRNLSADGEHAFFQTAEALLPQANGQMDVYEWEQEGVGSCGSGEGGNMRGCLYLISTGRSTSPSYFGDASENGEDVFFFTRQSLVAQDQDGNVDVYDARVDGGIAAQNAEPLLPCTSEACRGNGTLTPVFGAPSSEVFAGPGNFAPAAEESKPPIKPKPKPSPSNRVRRFAKALKACRRRPKRERAECEARARKTYSRKVTRSEGGGH